MLSWVKDKWNGFVARVGESLTWLSVQVTLGWGAMWVIYSQLDTNTMVEIAQVHVLHLSIPTWAGIMQTVTTYLARVKKKKDPQ